MGHGRGPVRRRRPARGRTGGSRGVGVESDPEPDHGLHRGGGGDVRPGAGGPRSAAGGPAPGSRRDRRPDRGALPFREPRTRRDRPARRDLLPLPRGRIPGAGLWRAAGTQARPGGRRAPAPARHRDAGRVPGRGEPARELYRRTARPDARQRLHPLAGHRAHRARPRRHRHDQGVRFPGAAHRSGVDEARRGRPAPRSAVSRPRPGARHRARSVGG